VSPLQTSRPRQKSIASVRERAFWFAVAGVVTVTLNAGLFTLFNDVLGWANWVAYALSLGILNVLQFVWSYHVGFRTNDHWTSSAKRQGVTLVVSNMVNYVLVVGLQALFPHLEKVIIVGVQVFVAGVKFLTYHHWVYPSRPITPDSDELAP
jgi:putative flippase GtrA